MVLPEEPSGGGHCAASQSSVGEEVAGESRSGMGEKVAAEALLRNQRKEIRAQKIVEAAERKRKQERRIFEQQGKRRAKEQVTLRSFYTTSRNSENLGPLDLHDPLKNKTPPSRKKHTSKQPRRVLLPNLVSLDTNVATGSTTSGLQTRTENCVILSSKPPIPVLYVSTDSPGYVCSEDDPDFNTVHGPPVETSDLSGDDMEEEELEPLIALGKPNYDLTRKFQMEWSAKCPWAEMVLTADGWLHMVKCRVCSDVGKKPRLMAPKWDTISKHGKRKVHKANLLLYAAKRPASVLQQINNCTSIEARRKRVQFATLFQLLCAGRPMAEFESKFSLYHLLETPNCPSMHWSSSAGWLMAEHMYSFIQERMKAIIKAARYIAMTCDETAGVDNCSYIALHVYVMQDWVRAPLLITLQKLESDGATADNLTALLVGILGVRGDLNREEIATKLLCFGADGVSAFHGCRTGVSVQLKAKFSPHVTAVHCMGHRVNLAVKTLSKLDLFHAVEDLCKFCHGYFSHSPKRQAEFRALAQLVDNKGLKLLRNVTTRWISLISPLRRLLSEYRSVSSKLRLDSMNKAEPRSLREKANDLLQKMLDPYYVVGMVCLLPLLEVVDVLIQFAQQRDVFICDFVGALQKCLGKLFELYKGHGSAFCGPEFLHFANLAELQHDQISLSWSSINLNDVQHLQFVLHGEDVAARHEGAIVTKESWNTLIEGVKNECKGAAEQLIVELTNRFPAHSLLDALGIVYPQYWRQTGAEKSFRKHLDVIKKFYGEPKWIGEEDDKRLVLALLDCFQLELQQHLFKLSMLSNSMAALEDSSMSVNPLTRLWRVIDANTSLAKEIPEYIKLAEIAMIHVLGSVEDERCFSSLAFLKDKLRNRLQSEHLSLVVRMHGQKVYTLEDFPYDKCFQQWVNQADHYRYGLMA